MTLAEIRLFTFSLIQNIILFTIEVDSLLPCTLKSQRAFPRILNVSKLDLDKICSSN